MKRNHTVCFEIIEEETAFCRFREISLPLPTATRGTRATAASTSLLADRPAEKTAENCLLFLHAAFSSHLPPVTSELYGQCQSSHNRFFFTRDTGFGPKGCVENRVPSLRSCPRDKGMAYRCEPGV